MMQIRWDQLRARPVNVALARKVAAVATCPECGSRLIIDHDDDPRGNGRLHCLGGGHEVAEVKLFADPMDAVRVRG
jgi:ribosomal protein S27AE